MVRQIKEALLDVARRGAVNGDLESAKNFLDVSRQCARMDVTIVLVLLVFCVLVIPAIPRATANANMLSVFIDDEVPLTMGLDAMTVFPFGNPARYYAIYGQVPPIPSYFNSFIYFDVWDLRRAAVSARLRLLRAFEMARRGALPARSLAPAHRVICRWRI